MPPTPEPTETQIEAVREIALLYSYEQAEKRVLRLKDAQWTATVLDIGEWGRVKNKHTKIKGDGVEIDKDDNRLDITNRVRRRLGLRAVESLTETNSECGSYVSYTAPRNDCL